MSDVTYSLICDILLYSYYKRADTSDLFLLRVGTIYPDTDDIIIEYEPQFSAYESSMWPGKYINIADPLGGLCTVYILIFTVCHVHVHTCIYGTCM